VKLSPAAAGIVLAAVALGGCGPRAGAAAGQTPTSPATPVAAGSSSTPPAGPDAPSSTAPTAAADAGQPAQAGHPTGGPAGAPTAGRTNGINYGDPKAVAAAWITARWTYNAAINGQYPAALDAAGLLSAAFAARSAPTAGQIQEAAASGDTASCKVTHAGIATEAPNTPATNYVTVDFVRSRGYRGAPKPQLQQAEWSMRLIRDPQFAGRPWRVDAIVIGDS